MGALGVVGLSLLWSRPWPWRLLPPAWRLPLRAAWAERRLNQKSPLHLRGAPDWANPVTLDGRASVCKRGNDEMFHDHRGARAAG